MSASDEKGMWPKMAEAKDGGQIVIQNKVLAAGFVQVPVIVMQDPDLSAGGRLLRTWSRRSGTCRHRLKPRGWRTLVYVRT